MGACTADSVLTDGPARLLRLRLPEGGEPSSGTAPVLLVPSLINRWYVLDLHARGSLAAALLRQGLSLYCLDWGSPGDEDRDFSWDDVLARLARMVRAVRRQSGSGRVGLLGYCLGGTLAAIHAALEPDRTAALVNLAGPIDFAEGGLLAHLTRRRWFDAEAIASAGNASPWMLQAGFAALRPTQALAKAVRLADAAAAPGDALDRALVLEGWASDNVPFPAAAYERYVRALYQENELVRGAHHVSGRRVDLGAIRCPVLTVVAERDTICPPAAALALNRHCGGHDVEALTVAGGHVGAVVGSQASKTLYPAMGAWLRARLRQEKPS